MVKTDTRNRILKHIQNNFPVKIKGLIEEFGISRQIIHRHLKKLLAEDSIIKKGSAPNVFYFPKNKQEIPRNFRDSTNLLKKNWLTVLPNGNVLKGENGFSYWCEQRGFDPEKKQNEYREIYNEYQKFRKKYDSINYIDATIKFREIYTEKALIKSFYLDFFSYPVFGRTKWGQLVLYSKLNEDKKLLKNVGEWARPVIEKIIEKYNIKAIAFVPHSLKREVPFLPFLRNFWKLNIPEIPLIKTSGEIVIPQKTLKKTSERVQNAAETIFIKPGFKNKFSRVLLIDDAVGSGATLQEVAKKIKQKKIATEVYGLALVGSVKGFEVISEI